VNRKSIVGALPRLAGAVLATGIMVGASSCGGGESSLSEQAQRGEDIAREKGCMGCHGANGQGGVGPSWIDLAGSQVELDEGPSVIADDDYLVRSIREPGAEEVAGYSLKMPPNNLNDSQVADIVAYIKELTTAPTE
jgi:cytochrome c oxidase subunit II